MSPYPEQVRYDTSRQVVLMLEMGWVFRWDLETVSHLGGSGSANAICLYEDDLYEGGLWGVIRWSTGEYLSDRRDSNVTAICAHGGRLYDASMGESRFLSSPQFGIYDTLTGKRVGKRQSKVLSLCSHGGQLYDCGVYGLYETLTNRRVEVGRTIQALCSHGGVLYDCAGPIISEALVDKVVASRDESVQSMCSHSKVLYDSGRYYGVRETFSGRKVLDYDHITYEVKTITNPNSVTKKVQCVYGMISIQAHLAEKFAPILRAKKIEMGR